ncbi:protein-glutamine gamma-glutamyltransferase K-like [Gigantopelta aegis]|uniref:protein-glutamine gamma-glutamyltransferase K-like n=1 Tax=Gigantopelta aegis TaxID=1735272 RepID=UPI001B88A17A|nr:protein-glutamine gamma-glutamyltransferase K-like [Gigantopelta aegis]
MGCVKSSLKTFELARGSADSPPPRKPVSFHITRNTYARTHTGVRNNNVRVADVSLEGTNILSSVPAGIVEEVLTVKDVNFNVVENATKHYTSEYDIADPEETRNPQLVVRRGQKFEITLQFNRAYDVKKDDLRLIFQAGENPMPSKGTHVEFVLSDKDEPKKWGAWITRQNGDYLQVTIMTPSNCYVGKWELKVDVVKKIDNKHSIFRYSHRDPIYLLFNPWCKDDMVYMPNERELKEYVLNESGKIYSGTARKITPKPWNFGQFQGNVLDCAMKILDESGLNWSVRGNPIPLVRKISALVNAPDDGGILVGNWSGEYPGGKSPLSWTGSVAILEEYYKTSMPVKYGQCWVFSGVVTTICRALGIPTRSVTNFASAHDTDGTITIDIHFDSEGELDDSRNFDSVWNFHVWNEVFMARPDLPTGFGGWQAIDATPQETSDGVYCCGPVSVEAIKQGEVNMPFDAPFVFAEVNADRVYWSVMPDGELVNVYIDKGAVGKNISTKAAGVSDREDVTSRYKFSEGSDGERVAVLKANQLGSTIHKDIYKRGQNDVKFSLLFNDDVFVGQDFEIQMKMVNNSKDTRTISGRLACKTVFYTGVPFEKCKSEPYKVVLKSGEVKIITVKVDVDDYNDKLQDCCLMDITAFGRVDETKQIFTKTDELRLRKPHLTIKVSEHGKVGQRMKVEISFVNPLPVTLTRCRLEVSGAGLQEPLIIKQGSVEAKKTFMTSVDLLPRKKGDRELIALFSSDQLDDINGSVTIHVQPK